ncbi:MAG TPA: type 2 isopentenyl-diphosphate Delta-isomerase [Methanothrix sp.]|nr:type 2 isopentenyl-diphosphate Delta-isomerase [Methanothrix sp.]HOK58114.1 type 2 isopentenyl-diphosphate Delta-isomerase [Methanothrix sp.]HOL43018.1 type 2 isopentenyl-diphosphate Delta-isomerase [Methanothrix sp.]HPO88021.1 type 2 isopentenyl-diphosphate Delta-isomerase [Methanothrix sp.]
METVRRKLEHIEICLEKQVVSRYRPFDDLILLHRALPEIDESDVSTECTFLNRRLSAPLMISAMTGGHPDAREINANLAIAAQETGIAIGVGSQRAALEHPDLEDTFSIVRELAPDVPVVGNIGAVQLHRYGPEVLDRVAEMVDADAVAVHLNFLQESVQPEGERHAGGVLDSLRDARFRLPIIIKETGCGIPFEDAKMLVDSGIRIIDVAGAGGTSWSMVESYRAELRGDAESKEIGMLFAEWGIPTPVSVIECSRAGAQVISSGGVRSGIDVARSIALGAFMAGAALPLLASATRGSLDVVRVLQRFVRELRISMFLTGSRSLQDLGRAPVIITGRTREILEQRGIDTKIFSSKR